MRRFRIVLFFLFLCLSTKLLVAQKLGEFRLESITSEYIKHEKGLSQNTANCIYQDSEGFLWVGTWKGLNRFDGYTFKSILKDFHNPTISLTNSTIVGITEDNQGYLWVAAEKGLNKVNRTKFTVKQFTVENSAHKGMYSDSINVIYKDSSGIIWLGTKQGALILNPETEEFTHIAHNPRDNRTLSDNNVTAFAEDEIGRMWIGTSSGLNHYTRNTGQMIKYFQNPVPGHLSSSEITALEICQKGYLWIGTPVGLNQFDPLTRWFERFYLINPGLSATSTQKNFISSLLNDSKDQLWVGTLELGVYLFNKGERSFANLGNFVPDNDLLNNPSIWDIMEDNTGLYWIGTSHRGLAKLVPEPHTFREYIRGYANYGIIEPEQDLFWFGTQNGIITFDRKLQITRRIISEMDNSNSLANDRITNLLLDGDQIWIATRMGLSLYNRKMETFQNFRPDSTNNSIAGDHIWDVIKAMDGSYWIATSTGISHYDQKTNSFTNYRHDPSNRNTISNNFCYDIFELEPGIFLISTQYGLNRFNARAQTWDVYLPVPGDITSISAEYIFGVMKDSHEEIWVYTNGGGFNRFDPNTGTFEQFTEKDDLSDNTVYAMTEDIEGIIWITTNDGLSRFDPVESRFSVFDVQDGILSNEFNLNSIYQSKSGEIFVGGVNGVNSFYPQATIGSTIKPPVKFTGFSVAEIGGRIEIPITDRIVLKHDQNSFSVSFAALDYLNPFKNRYEFFLENYDKNWNSLELGDHIAEYTQVPPGNYSMHVVGSNNLGISADNVLYIKIVPAWWQTLLFKISVVLTSIALLMLIIVIRYRSIQRKHEMETSLLNIRNELIDSQKFALRSQMNPHFIFNSLNSIQNFVLKNDVDSANYYLSNFSTMMRKVLEYSQHNFISLSEETQLIELYLKMEKLRFPGKFETIITIDPNIDIYQAKIPPMLLQPYLENAILHGLQLIKHRGLLELIVNKTGDHMEILIKDNGIGREKAMLIRQRQAHKSKGLKNIEKRIQLYNRLNERPIIVDIQDLINDNDEANGTLVRLQIPLELDELIN